MERHSYFDLWLHDDAELTSFIGSRVIQRDTLHQWPLSCVQRIRLASGANAIYKVQAPPTVEPAFYQRARSPLLVKTKLLPHDHGPDALLMEDVQATSLTHLPMDEKRRLDVVDDILAQIAQIAGELPALNDIRTPERWLEHGKAICADLQALVSEGRFQRVTPAMIERFVTLVHSPSVMNVIHGSIGFVHMDLQAENVLVLDHSYRVLDWQRPIWGPVALDRVTLMESVGLDPLNHGMAGALQLRTLLLIGWLAQAARHWFPPGTPTYDTEIARLIASI